MIKIDKYIVLESGQGNIRFHITSGQKQADVNLELYLDMDSIRTYYTLFYGGGGEEIISRYNEQNAPQIEFLDTWVYSSVNELKQAKQGWGPKIIEKCEELAS